MGSNSSKKIILSSNWVRFDPNKLHCVPNFPKSFYFQFFLFTFIFFYFFYFFFIYLFFLFFYIFFYYFLFIYLFTIIIFLFIYLFFFNFKKCPVKMVYQQLTLILADESVVWCWVLKVQSTLWLMLRWSSTSSVVLWLGCWLFLSIEMFSDFEK